MSIQSTGLSDSEVGDGALHPVTPKQAAAILDCNVKSIYEAIKRGEIAVIKIGRLRLIPRPAFERLLRDGTEAA
jgi:excisionase family DNA binding protein